jgi:hypothetical protein
MKSHFKLFIIISLCLCFIFSLISEGKADIFYDIYATPPTFNPNAMPMPETTTISAGLWADTSRTEALCWLKVYDINHALVNTLTYPVDSLTPNITAYKEYYVPWNGKNTSGITVSNGIYPYHIDAVSWVETFTTDYGTNYPYDVAAYIYYWAEADWTYEIALVSDTGKRIMLTGDCQGLGDGHWWNITPTGFTGPAYGITAASDNGKFYVLDSDSKKLFYITSDLLDVAMVTCGQMGTTINWASYSLWSDAITPSDLACSSDGTIFYAVDKGTNKVYKSIDSGANWNQCAAQPGLAASPSLTGVAVDPNNSNIVLVADGANGDIYKSDNGCAGFTRIYDGTAQQAYQVSFDNDGYFWLSNVANKRVSEVNPINTLEVLRIGTGAGDQRYKFNATDGAGTGIALGLFANYSPWLDNKYLYVADYYNKKVKKYVYDNYGSDPPVGTNIVVSASSDTTPPSAITDLSIEPEDPLGWWYVIGSDYVMLQWTSPGNDDNAPATRARAYDLRYSKNPITTGNFNSANRAIVEYTSHATNNTSGKTTFEVQENISQNTQSSGYISVIDYTDRSVQEYEYASWSGKIFYLDTGPPAVTLDRTYDGNDKVSLHFPYVQGNPYDGFQVTGLESNTIYYFAIKSSDEKNNTSGLSNTPVSGKTGLLLEWNMVSCPLDPIPNNSSLSVFGDDAGLDWMFKWISTWTGPTDTNCATACQTVGASCPHSPPPQCYCSPDCDGSWVQVSTIVPAEGILLYSTKNYDPTDATGADIIDFSSTVSLITGWNMVGNPYGANVSLINCNVYNPGAPEPKTRTYEQAVTAGWIENGVYIWNGITYIDYPWDSAELELWKGYWVKAYYNLDLIINKP